MVVAIDGPAGTGKSSVCARVAQITGFFYVNSGRFYRAVTRRALREGVDLGSPQALEAIAQAIQIELVGDDYVVDGEVLDQELHTPHIDAHVAEVSSVVGVRHAVNRRLKEIAGRRNIIVEGRDMSTVVFPDADLKFYLDADTEVRARRRHAQLGHSVPFETVIESMRSRDSIDTTKETGRLERAPDAVYIDSTDLTLEQVCETVVGAIHNKNITRQE